MERFLHQASSFKCARDTFRLGGRAHEPSTEAAPRAEGKVAGH